MNGCFLKFYVAENRRHRHRLAYEWLLEEAKSFGLHGGSAFRALAGFGRHGRLHDERFFELAGDLPVEVGFVVTREEADSFLAHIAEQGLNLFYLRVPVDYGFTDPPLDVIRNRESNDLGPDPRHGSISGRTDQVRRGPLWTRSLQTLLFPDAPRSFRGDRWVNIALRCLHLVGVAGIGGGFLLGAEESLWQSFWHLTLASGLLLALLYLWSSMDWLFRLKGLTIVLKVLLLAIALALPAWRAEFFVLIMALSGLIAHAPGEVRGWSPRRWRRGSSDKNGCRG